MLRYAGYFLLSCALSTGLSFQAFSAKPIDRYQIPPESKFENLSDQAIANQLGQVMKLRRIPQIVYGCEYPGSSNFAGLNIPADYGGGGKIMLCNDGIRSFEERIWVIAHELGHSQAYQSGLPSTEDQADINGIDCLASQGMWTAIGIKANAQENRPQRLPGTKYAQQKIAQRNQ